MNIQLLPRGKRIIYLILAIILQGLEWMEWVNPIASSFCIGLCFGMIYLSLKGESKGEQ